jgi:acyl carrier protein
MSMTTTKTEDDVRQAVTAILSELGVEPDSVADSAALSNDLELDSTDAVEIGLALKRRFNVPVKVQVKGGETVGDLIALVLQEIQQTGS